MTSAPSASNAAYKHFLEVLNTKDPALLDKTIDEFCAPDLLFHASLPFGASGWQALKYVMEALHKAFLDLHVALYDALRGRRQGRRQASKILFGGVSWNNGGERT